MVRFLFVLLLALLPVTGHADPVKLSGSGICHDSGSPWYDRTGTFDPMPDMDSCLEVGRPYSGYAPQAAAPRKSGPPEYDRGLYGGWIDADSDCRNTRQELLAEMSTLPVAWNEAGCTVLRGRWLDPYSGKVFLDASGLDIDHVVPLAYAHERGAALWDRDKRRAFANDRRNLLAVDASENRSKGAQGPAEWLPSNAGFECQYLLRFDRIMRIYGLTYGEIEGAYVARRREASCGGGTG